MTRAGYWPVAEYLRENPDAHERRCHCGCGTLVVQDKENTTRYHATEECAARCLARRAGGVN